MLVVPTHTEGHFYLKCFHINYLYILGPRNLDTYRVLYFYFIAVLVIVVLYRFHYHRIFGIEGNLLNHNIKNFLACDISNCMSTKIVDNSTEKTTLICNDHWNLLLA